MHAVFIEALRRLAEYDHLPAAEEPLNLWLFWLAVKVRFEQEQAKWSAPRKLVQ